MDSIETLLLEVGLMATSFAVQFLLPGFGGLLLSGLIYFAEGIGVQIQQGNLTQNPMYYITRLLGLFMPQAQKLILTKVPLLAKASALIDKTNKVLGKVQNLFMDDFMSAIRDPKNFFKSDGLTANIVEDIKKINLQDKVQEVLGKDVTKIEPIFRRAPNTKNIDSWIMSVEFQEVIRFGKKIIGSMTVTYCFNNNFRVGYRQVPTGPIVFGRTSQGKINHTIEKANAERYRKVVCAIDPNKYKLVRVTFENCSFYGDFLPFLRAYSWGRYYMTNWMIGMPGSVADKLSPFIFFGSLERLHSRITSIMKTGQDMIQAPGLWWSKKVEQFAIKYATTTKLGSKKTLAHASGVFSKVNQMYHNPFVVTEKQLNRYVVKVQQKALKRRRKRQEGF